MKTIPSRLIPVRGSLSLAVRMPVFALALAGLTATVKVQAANILKADNNSALNVGTSWVGGVAPGTGDIAVWNNTVQVNTNDDALGAATSWGGIQVADPGGPLLIPADGNTLTLGAYGVNMLEATNSLQMSNNVTLGAPQYWQVGNGQTLDLEGAITAGTGNAILFEFDTNVLDDAIINPSATGSVLTSGNNTLLISGPIANGTGDGVAFGTVNDVDFAGLNGNNQIVPANTISGLYVENPSGGTPTIGSLSGVYDFYNTNSVGARIASTYYVIGLRFNTPQPNPASSSTYAYNGVGSWEVLFKSGNTFDVNSVLVTTNVGQSYVVFGSGGFVRIANTLNEMLIFQNNPASRLIFQSPISNRTAGAIVAKMGAGTLEYQAACTYTGGTQIRGGTLLVDLAGTAGSGPITVYTNANFEGQSFTTNFAPVSVANGGTNSVLVALANGQFVNNTNLTFNPGSTWLQFIYSNSIVPSTTTAALLVTNGTLTASNTVNINVVCSSLSVGQFPLVKYQTLVTNTATGFPFNLVGIQPHVSAYLSNNVANNSVDLVVTGDSQPIHWAVGNGAWDIGLTTNWEDVNGNPTTYQQVLSLADNVVFNDTASGPSPITVTLSTNVTPASVTVSDSAINYAISGSGSIGGGTGITKTGAAELVLSTTNSFTGGINLNGGIVNFSTLNNLGAGAINFGGGTLQYNGNTDDVSVRTVTFNSGGATIDTAGQTVSFANTVGNGGAGGLSKNGLGTLTLNGTNKYSGNTIVNAGTLALGAGGYIPNSPVITVNSGATLDTASSGVGLALASGQTLDGAGTVNGEVTNTLGTISPATNGVFGTLSLANDFVINGGTLAMSVSTTNSDLLAVATNLTISSGTLQLNPVNPLTNGTYRLITYGGSLLSGPGSSANLLITGFSSTNQLPSLSDAKPGEIDLIIAAGAHDIITWSGAGNTWDTANSLNWYLNGNPADPWAYTNGDLVTFNDVGGANPTVLLTNVTPSLVLVSNNAETYDFKDGTGTGAGSIQQNAVVVKDGTGTAIFETANSYSGGTLIKNGVLQIGNGLTGDIGSPGSITNNASLVFDQGAGILHTVGGVISGTGTLTDNGSDTVALTNNNTYSGGTTVNSGNLQVGGGGAGGSLGTGPVTNNAEVYIDRSGTQTLNNNITGSGPIVFLGTATTTYGGANTYTGTTYISNGIVRIGASTAILADGTGDALLELDGGSVAGALDVNGHNLNVNGISGVNGAVNGVIDNNGGSSTVTNTLAIVGTATATYSGAIVNNTGSGGKIALLVNGGGNQTLDIESASGNNYSGGTIISNSTVTLTQAGEINGTYVGLGTGQITLENGTIYAVGAEGQSTSPSWNSLGNTILIPTNFTGTINGPQRGTMLANIIGSGTLNYINAYVRGAISGNWSAFTGQIIFGSSANGGQLGIASTNGFGHVFCTNSSGAGGVTFYNTVAGTPIIPIGELADDGSTLIEANSSGNAGGVPAYFAIGGLNTSTNFGGSIIDNVGIIKVGTGSWTLTNSVLTYTNLTTVSNGVLVLSTNCTLPNSTPVTIASPGILDVTATSPLALGAAGMPQVLQGNGTINGGVSIGADATLVPGGTNVIGTLTLTSNLDLTGGGAGGGVTLMELDRTNSPATNDMLVAPSVTGGGTLVVTNIGPALINGSTFTLFSVPVSGFTSTVLPATDPTGTMNYNWANNLSLNGSITLTSGGTSPNPTNITASLSANVLSLSWPADHLGWYLQVQTNSLSHGLGANWVDVPGSSLVTDVTVTIIPTNPAVFYRMSINP